MNKKIILWLLILPLLMGSCDKFLDKQPENQISIDALFTDMAGAKAALTGVYLSLWNSDYLNGPRMTYPEAVGGNVKLLGRRQTLADVYRFTAEADSSSMNSIYSGVYTMLNNVNNIIKRVPAIEVGLQTERNDILAQAYGLRAMLHFDLVQMYAQPYSYTSGATHPGIILATEPILVATAQRKRATVYEVYEQIEADLKTAEELFLNSKVVFTGRRTSYINSAAIHALRARVALCKEDWTTAYDYSTTVLADGFSLYSTAEYVPSWSTSYGKETIFEINVPLNSTGNSLLGKFYYNNSLNEYYQFEPSTDLLGLFQAGDIRASGGVFKYVSNGILLTSIKMIRLSEVLLIRAEAAAELGNTQVALTELNKIRLRGNPSLTEWTNTEKTALIREIMNERRRELCLEGIRFFDMMRRGLSLERKDCEGLNCNMSFPSEKFVLPIPLQSVYSNPEMEQNPGY